MRRFVLFCSLSALCSLVVAGTSVAKQTGAGFTLVQSATLVHPGNGSPTAAEVASTGPSFTWGAVDLAIAPQLKLRQLNDLATDYKFVLGSCWGGSPRFEAWVTTATGTHKIFFYIGPPPSWTGCPPGVYANTGNLASPSSIVDDSQLPGGSYADPYANAQARYGSYPVTAVYLDADGGWYSNQTVDFDNTQVNSVLFTYDG
jgi:hypothetical protein